ncbi:MAG: IclR family transcriptional regulator [Anaerolineae bacterium]|nr:IclR family transcriptional regulator [Anaerolineae bacterium]
MKDRSIYNVRAIERSIDILSCFDDEAPEKTIAEIASAVGLPRPTTLRLLSTLASGGLVERTADGGRYRLGPHLITLGIRVVDRLEVRRLARPVMLALEERFEETCDLGIFSADEVLYLEIVPSRHALRLAGSPGIRSPAHCTASGKVFLAHLPPERLAQILSRPLKPYTANTITSPERLLEELEEVRIRGYAVDDQELNPGVRAVSAPIRDRAGHVVAALGMPGPVERMTSERMSEIGEALVEAGETISARLGYAATAPRR